MRDESLKGVHSIAAREGAVRSREVPFAAQHLDSLPDDARIDVKAVAVILGIATSTVWLWTGHGWASSWGWGHCDLRS